jgi:hypothetical protein
VRIPEKDIKLLWGRAAERCTFPDCRTALSRTPEGEAADYPLGEQAHIVSHAKGGVRDDGSVPEEERDRYENLILLCRHHHVVIDREPGIYTIARLQEMKTEHERWVSESLATENDRVKLAAGLTYAALVESAVENRWPGAWQQWTNQAVQPTPRWHEDLPGAIGSFTTDVFRANFPGELEELEWALQAAAAAAGSAARTFEQHATAVPGRSFLRGDQFYRLAAGTPRSRAALEEWARWCKHCYAWIYETAKGVNWLAEIVRRDLDSLFFAADGKFVVYEDNLESGHRTLLVEYEPGDRTAERAEILRELADRGEAPTYDFLEKEFAQH